MREIASSFSLYVAHSAFS